MSERVESKIIVNQMPSRRTLGRFLARGHTTSGERADVYFDTESGSFVDKTKGTVEGVPINRMPDYRMLTDYLRSMTDEHYNIEHPVVFNNETGSFGRLS